jgi:hypothetical protein
VLASVAGTSVGVGSGVEIVTGLQPANRMMMTDRISKCHLSSDFKWVFKNI